MINSRFYYVDCVYAELRTPQIFSIISFFREKVNGLKTGKFGKFFLNTGKVCKSVVNFLLFSKKIIKIIKERNG